ncbi:Festuclavine dehydrogenase [Cyphellophora attinorum]|uniref:Festuclavine dehydrogenase n=1 Tax=Cyphellophora attinorum TaxID=1664694 RepID=A0A0N1NYF0_9EURO|nr:Festuclavine dehydrogenase [Phialophora attinorum]KPI36586.1 Festuclavine dehydrogenase [Phialophora attinorum]
MTILITGSSGKTARPLTALLKSTVQLLIASRSGKEVDGIPAVKLDWSDTATYANPFEHPQAQSDPIQAVYLVSQPGNVDPSRALNHFIDVAQAHGVRRFVLLSAIREDESTSGTGKAHAYLKGLGVEWAVLRPTWFMENFSEQHHYPTIKKGSEFYSATGEGRISFVSTEDVAAVAYQALMAIQPPNQDYIIVGGELLSHEDVAVLFTNILGRQVRHVAISPEQLVQRFTSFGLPATYAKRLADGENRARRGEFAILNDVVAEVTGRPPITLQEYIQKNKQVW